MARAIGVVKSNIPHHGVIGNISRIRASTKKLLRNKDSTDREILPEVKVIIEKKLKLISMALKGKNIAQDPNVLLPFFTRDQIRRLALFNESWKQQEPLYKLFDEMLLKTVRGTLAEEEASRAAENFGDTIASKMTIICNDRIRFSGSSRPSLPEDLHTIHIRNLIEEGTKGRHEIINAIAFLNGLKRKKFDSETDFVASFNSIGPNVKHWLEDININNKSRLIQYAVGNNARIENPYYGSGVYLDVELENWKSWEDACGPSDALRLTKKLKRLPITVGTM